MLTTGRILATVSGAVLGGILTTRWGIFRALWVLGVVQALSSLGYAGAPPRPRRRNRSSWPWRCSRISRPGLGTAAFVAFLMSVCERRYAATQYAVLSALLALTRSVAGRRPGPGRGVRLRRTTSCSPSSWGCLPSRCCPGSARASDPTRSLAEPRPPASAPPPPASAAADATPAAPAPRWVSRRRAADARRARPGRRPARECASASRDAGPNPSGLSRPAARQTRAPHGTPRSYRPASSAPSAPCHVSLGPGG